jgi:hypothetical protein
MLIRRESPADTAAVRAVTVAAFSRPGGGVGQALVHAVLGAADALDEPLVVRPPAAWTPGLTGAFRYATPFESL